VAVGASEVHSQSEIELGAPGHELQKGGAFLNLSGYSLGKMPAIFKSF
jgi:hypothetical protein